MEPARLLTRRGEGENFHMKAAEGKKTVRLGLAGFGTVGGGVHDVLARNGEILARRCGAEVTVKTVVCRQLDKARARVAGDVTVTGDWHAIVNDPEIDIAVELMGGIHPALEYILAAIAAGKHVITANKALLAHHGNEIFAAAEKAGVIVAFEAAVAGGIPIIKALREGLAANRIEWAAGIINGTSNYILTTMREKGASFADVLADAQRLGYAEADPTFDINGTDAAHKITLVSAIAFGTPVNFDAAYVEGIDTLAAEDIAYAEEMGYRIKLLGITKRRKEGIELRVHPTLVPKRRLLAGVEGVMNGVVVKGDAVGSTLYYGRGAGGEPTASAVIADIADTVRMMSAGSEHQVPMLGFQEKTRAVRWLAMDDTVSSYYLRILVDDRPGVLADVTRIFADNAISIETLRQREAAVGENETEVVLMTHTAREGNVKKALAAIEALPAVHGRIVMIRKEELN